MAKGGHRKGAVLTKLEHEVFRKPPPIALYRFVQPEGGHFVQLGEVAVEHHFVPADEENPPLDQFNGTSSWPGRSLLRHEGRLLREILREQMRNLDGH